MKLPPITPGPWATYDRRDLYPDRDDVVEVSYPNAGEAPDTLNGGKVVALAYGPDCDANARAIAQVPAMLEALVEAREIALWQCELDHPTVAKLDKVLRAAGVELGAAGGGRAAGGRRLRRVGRLRRGAGLMAYLQLYREG